VQLIGIVIIVASVYGVSFAGKKVQTT